MARAARLLLLLALVRWTRLFLVWPMRQDVVGASVLHLVSIPFHEEGHILFAPLGDLMASLGGSLAQVLARRSASSRSSPRTRTRLEVTCLVSRLELDGHCPVHDDARPLQPMLLGGRTGAR